MEGSKGSRSGFLAGLPSSLRDSSELPDSGNIAVSGRIKGSSLGLKMGGGGSFYVKAHTLSGRGGGL
jgi:hypothetical protein